MKKLLTYLFTVLLPMLSLGQVIEYINDIKVLDYNVNRSGVPPAGVLIGEWDTDGINGREKVFSYGKEIIITDLGGGPERRYGFDDGWRFMIAIDTDGIEGIEIVIKNGNNLRIIHDKDQSVKEYTIEGTWETIANIDLEKIPESNLDGKPGAEIIVNTKKGLFIIFDKDKIIDVILHREGTWIYKDAFELDGIEGFEICLEDTVLTKKYGDVRVPIESTLIIYNVLTRKISDFPFGRELSHRGEWKIEATGKLDSNPGNFLVVSWKNTFIDNSNLSNTVSFLDKCTGGFMLISYYLNQKKNFLIYSRLLTTIDPKDFTLTFINIINQNINFELEFSPRIMSDNIPPEYKSPIKETGSIHW